LVSRLETGPPTQQEVARTEVVDAINPFAADLCDEIPTGSSTPLGTGLTATGSGIGAKTRSSERAARLGETAMLVVEDEEEQGVGNPFDDDLAADFGSGG
jgi:hypothetical protein